jgi:hypothetical protein
MNALFLPYPIHQVVEKTAPAVPPELQQLAHQLREQAQQAMDSLAYYGLLVACLTAVVGLLLSSLLLFLDRLPRKPVQPEVRLRLLCSGSAHQPLKRSVSSCVVRANRNEFRYVASRIRFGQLSN